MHRLSAGIVPLATEEFLASSLKVSMTLTLTTLGDCLLNKQLESDSGSGGIPALLH
jgi:hypothetical protein